MYHISGNSAWCLDSCVEIMHQGITYLHFFKQTIFFLSHFSLFVLGPAPYWSHHFGWFTCRTSALPPVPVYYPIFLHCWLLHPEEEGNVFLKMSEYLYRAKWLYNLKSSIRRWDFVYPVPPDDVKVTFVICPALGKRIKCSGTNLQAPNHEDSWDSHYYSDY
jgi:hypothetical protein